MNCLVPFINVVNDSFKHLKVYFISLTYSMSLQSDLVTWANQPHIPKYLKKFLEIWQFMNIAIKFLSFLNVPKLVLKGNSIHKKDVYIYIYNWVTLLYSGDQHNTVNQLHFSKKKKLGTSLVDQWLRIHFPMQKPVCHNYWACALWSSHT